MKIYKKEISLYALYFSLELLVLPAGYGTHSISVECGLRNNDRAIKYSQKMAGSIYSLGFGQLGLP
jgi:hypothetical protein